MFIHRILSWRRHHARTLWAALILLVCFGLVAEAFDLATVWLWVFVGLAASLSAYRRSAIPHALQDAGPAGDRLAREGFLEFAVLLLIVGIVCYTRTSSRLSALYFVVGYGTLCMLGLFAFRRAANPIARAIKMFIALTIGPFLIAWFVVSMMYLGFTLMDSRFGPVPPGLQERTATRAQRSVRMDTWQGPPVVVALSGGGYRASVTHAGLLWTLDRAGIPVHVVSGVSGGAIAGATYATGWKPEEFRDFLARKRPGLTNDMFNLIELTKQILYLKWGSGDTYANHFRRVYFGDAGFDDTGPPVLILNATDYAEGIRAAFWPDHPADVKLARVVAASAAFPAAFDPVRIEGRRYMDGGVIENLGIEGVRLYIEDSVPPASMPGLLIISDMSNDPREAPVVYKPSVPQMAIRAQQVSYQALHKRIYELYTDGAYDRDSKERLVQPYTARRDILREGAEGAFAVFVLSPISRAERWRFTGPERAVIERVAALETLRELDTDEVHAAFWAGARLAKDYLPDICAAAGVTPVPEVDLPGPP